MHQSWPRRRTQLALETWDTLTRNASTPSTILLEPPAATAPVGPSAALPGGSSPTRAAVLNVAGRTLIAPRPSLAHDRPPLAPKPAPAAAPPAPAAAAPAADGDGDATPHDDASMATASGSSGSGGGGHGGHVAGRFVSASMMELCRPSVSSLPAAAGAPFERLSLPGGSYGAHPAPPSFASVGGGRGGGGGGIGGAAMGTGALSSPAVAVWGSSPTQALQQHRPVSPVHWDPFKRDSKRSYSSMAAGDSAADEEGEDEHGGASQKPRRAAAAAAAAHQ